MSIKGSVSLLRRWPLKWHENLLLLYRSAINANAPQHLLHSYVMLHKIKVLIELIVEVRISKHLLLSAVVVPLFHAVVCQRVVCWIKLVGKHLRTWCEQWQIFDAKDAHHAYTLTGAWEVKWPCAPVLEAGHEWVRVFVSFCITCKQEKNES